MRVDWFDYELPESLIAQTPLADRTASRLLVMNRETGALTHRHFYQIEEYLQAGDVLVLNQTKVLPARLFGVKTDTGAKCELLLLKQEQNHHWEVLTKPAKRLKVGTEVAFAKDEAGEWLPFKAIVKEVREDGRRLIEFVFEGIWMEWLERLGTMPLPPYISEQLEDQSRYQTVYARESGSAAAPTAGLHFTEDLLFRLQQKGIQLVFVTLHVGLGTFRPVAVDTIEEHQMHAEWYEIDAIACQTLRMAKQTGKRILAVGTTSCRVLETVGTRVLTGDFAHETGLSGWTDIFIYPGYEFQLVEGLITNFHLPKSTLVMLVSALSSREHILAAYKEAVSEHYRFFSFGDAMLIMKNI